MNKDQRNRLKVIAQDELEKASAGYSKHGLSKWNRFMEDYGPETVIWLLDMIAIQEKQLENCSREALSAPPERAIIDAYRRNEGYATRPRNLCC
jgi:hypothetical protein